jgi:hypothetical protein
MRNFEAAMLAYLKKFILDILPSVAATVIGAFVVHYYIVPSAQKATSPVAVSTSAESRPAPTDNDAFAKGIAEKTSIDKTAERASEKGQSATAADSKRRVAKTGPHVPESSAPEPAGDARTLARAALERLRGGEAPRAVQAATHHPAETSNATGAQAIAAAAPAPIATPVTIPAGSADWPNPQAATAPAAALPPLETRRTAEAPRPTPPADIPAAPPIELQTAPAPTTVADDVVSAAKSVFHAVLPR